eukprot:Clim_evm3s188 gene=Clim_evmTU3s188
MSDTRVARRSDAGRTLYLIVGLFIVAIVYGAFIHSNIQVGHGQSSSAPSVVMPDKTKWPELVGANKDNAVATIQAERPDLTQVTALPNGSMVTADYREDRVRVFYDSETENVGPRAPMIG